MKLHKLLKYNSTFLLSITALAFIPNKFRDPFEFEHIQQEIKPTVIKPEVALSKWDIEDSGNGLLILKNPEDGQRRIIEISSFMK